MIKIIAEKAIKNLKSPNTLDDVFNNLKTVRNKFYNYYYDLLKINLPYYSIKIREIAENDFKDIVVEWEDGRPVLKSNYGCAKIIFDEDLKSGRDNLILYLIDPDSKILNYFKSKRKKREGFYLAKIKKEEINMFLFNYLNFVSNQLYKRRINSNKN